MAKAALNGFPARRTTGKGRVRKGHPERHGKAKILLSWGGWGIGSLLPGMLLPPFPGQPLRFRDLVQHQSSGR